MVERPTIGAGLRHADPPWRRGSLPVHHIQTDCLPSTVGGHVGYLMKLVQKTRWLAKESASTVFLSYSSCLDFLPFCPRRHSVYQARPVHSTTSRKGAAKSARGLLVQPSQSLDRSLDNHHDRAPPPAPFGAFLAHRWAFQAPNKAAPRFSTSQRRCKALSLSRPTEAPRKRVNR